MNRPSVKRSLNVALPVRQFLFLGMALLLTLAAGLFYYSWQTARLADQVAAQTALLTQIQASRANTLVKAAEPVGQRPVANNSPSTVDNIVPEQRWVF
ncbi:hypothetical protein [Pseudomonas sp. NBRC 111124]|uniref:hypothetical protein n=1 Tax=Pseudomonas sp. NBRC 111124 TaxID=1661039 RepID=UPI0007615FE8|nr:hypothetical protein [Pseudomonas sp. NBRC 111124]